MQIWEGVMDSAVRIDYFCSRQLVDYLSTSRLIVDYFSYNTRITFQRCM